MTPLDAQIISLRVNLERAYDDLTRVYTERDEARKKREDLEYELATTYHMYGDPEKLVDRIAELEARLRTLETQLLTSSNARVAAEAEVARLREALERIAEGERIAFDDPSWPSEIAREALAGGGQ